MRINCLLDKRECAVDMCRCYFSSVLRSYKTKWN